MNKRGISAVVATVLILLITVASVTIVWTAIIPMIKDNLDFSSLEGRVSVVSSSGYTFYDSDNKVTSVQVKRESDEGVMNRINILFSVGGDSFGSSVVAPESGGSKVYVFDLSGYGEPDRVSVAPIFAVGEREKAGTVTSEVDIKMGNINEPKFVYEVGRDYFYEIPRDGLIGWWKFDNNTKDSIGGGLGVGAGVTFVGSGYSKSADFSSSDGIDAGTFGAPVLTNATTVSFWTKVNSRTVPSRQNFFDQAYGGWGTMTLETNGKISWYFGSDGGNNPSYNSHQSDGIVVNGEWAHVVGVRDPSDHSYKWYKDGVFLSGGSYSVTYPVINDRVLTLGDGYTHPVNGLMDDFMIYNKALSEEEIVAIYETQKKN